MNLKKLFKNNGKILAIATTAIGAIGWLANDKMNKIKKQDGILEIVKSAEFKNAIVEIINVVINQEGGINSQITDIKNNRSRDKDKIIELQNADEADYREISDKLSKHGDAGVERYISNIERVRESDIRSCERDLRSCERDLQIYSDLLKIKSR